jgi:hypothetical protein
VKREAEDVFVAFESRPPGGVPSDGASGQHEKNAPAGFGGLPGASMASDEMVVGFDRRGGVTKLRLTDPLMQRAEQSTLWITASEDGASATCVGVAPACKDLRSGPNKSEREPTSARSTDYGSGHLIPAFHGTGRTFSLLPSHPLDAASRSIDAPCSRA